MLYLNQLTGPIPEVIGNLTDLTELYLHDNELTGPIPEEICRLNQLLCLYLADNELTGSIPDAIGQLTNLTTLYCGNNQLTGSIPEGMGLLTELQGLYLQNNLLTGEIPSSMFTLSCKVYIGNNYLVHHDEIPGSWSQESAFRLLKKPKMMTYYHPPASVDVENAQNDGILSSSGKRSRSTDRMDLSGRKRRRK